MVLLCNVLDLIQLISNLRFVKNTESLTELLQNYCILGGGGWLESGSCSRWVEVC